MWETRQGKKLMLCNDAPGSCCEIPWKSRGRGGLPICVYWCLPKLLALLAWTQLQRWWKMNIGCQVSPMSAGSPDSTLSCGGPLPTLNAPLSSAGDTDFSKILCGPCVQMPVACSLCCPSKGVGFKTHPETREKCLHRASQEAGSTAFCFGATGYRLPRRRNSSSTGNCAGSNSQLLPSFPGTFLGHLDSHGKDLAHCLRTMHADWLPGTFPSAFGRRGSLD